MLKYEITFNSTPKVWAQHSLIFFSDQKRPFLIFFFEIFLGEFEDFWKILNIFGRSEKVMKSDETSEEVMKKVKKVMKK